MDFHQFDHQFCEATLYPVEYANAISSLFITFIGLNGMRQGHSTIIFFHSTLAINGVTSCFYHFYNSIGWGLMDRMSMILIAIASFQLFFIPIGRMINQHPFSIVLGKAINLFAVFYFAALMTAAGLHQEAVFNFLFGLFLMLLPCIMYAITQNQKHLKVPVRIVKLGIDGIKYIAGSAVFWILTEHFCSMDYIKYFYGHVWWHIGISYGGYLLSLTPAYILLYSHLNVQLRYDNFGLPYLSYYRSIEGLV